MYSEQFVWCGPGRSTLVSAVLLFEFFPAFVAIVGVIVAIMLFVKDRKARENNEPEEPVTRPRLPPPGAGPEHTGRRPSMRA